MFNVIFFISKSEDLNPEITYTFFHLDCGPV